MLRRLSWAPPAEITLESLREALANMGARDWQLDATGEAIYKAFVEASQTNETASEGES